MKIKSNRDGSKWIEITKALLLFKPYSKVKFYFKEAPRFKGLYGYKNCRFKIHFANFKNKGLISNLRVFIRLPFFLGKNIIVGGNLDYLIYIYGGMKRGFIKVLGN